MSVQLKESKFVIEEIAEISDKVEDTEVRKGCPWMVIFARKPMG